MDAFPQLRINVKDDSAYIPIATEILPLHRSHYAMKTEKGPIGIPTWCANYDRAVDIFGAKTFDSQNKEYFSRSSVFLLNSLPHTGAFITRVGIDDGSTGTMTKASLVLECTVPSTDDGTFTYSVRALTGNETISTVAVSGSKYPVLAIQAKEFGKFGNSLGVRFFGDAAENLNEDVVNLGSFKYSIGFVTKDDNFNTYTKVKTKYSPYEFSFTGKADVINPANKLIVDFNSSFARYFGTTYPAPVNVHIYSANISAIADAAIDLYSATASEAVIEALTDTTTEAIVPERLNILTMKVIGTDDLEIALHADATTNIESEDGLFIGKNSAQYMVGGLDGNTDISGVAIDNNNAIETLIGKFYTLDMNAAIVDKPRYPFNTIVDTGYSSSLKDDIVGFLAHRDDVIVAMSTWAGESKQTEAEANSVGAALVAKIRLTPESEIFGTGCCRGIVFGQTGILNGELYTKTVPLTIWYSTKLAEYHNLQYINKNPAGLPNSEVAMFKEINWIPSDSTVKRSMWDECINYCQFYDMTHLHFAALKTVYQYDTSVLSSVSFVNAVVYTKQAVYPIWAKYSGIEELDLNVLYAQVIADAENKLTYMLGGKYGVVATMFQTEEEALVGYIHHVNVELTGGPQQRVWNLDIICKRTNFKG